MKPEQLQQAERNLSDPLWRLNHLYSIVNKEGVKTTFKLNWAQQEVYDSLWYCNIILKARQLGISTFVCLLYLDRCLFNSNCTAGIIAHTREDAEVLFRRVKFAYENLPEEFRILRSVNMDNARELQFNNGSILRVGTSMRGSTLQYLHISEFGKICAKYPDKAKEIITGSLNTLAPGQYVIIESTAEGREGAFYEVCKEAQAQEARGQKLSKLDYKMLFFPWYKHPDYRLSAENVVIPNDIQEYFDALAENEKIELSPEQKAWYSKKKASQGDDMKREYPSTPQEAFETANEGLYYGALMTRARQEKRICKVYLDENLPVHTAWDLGFSDSMSIWWFQICGQEVHLLEYYENSGEPLTFYLKLIKQKDYSYGKHFVPHDAAVTELGSGLTRIETAANHNIQFTLAPRLSVGEGIDAVRNILNRCWFEEQKCATGIKMIESYKRAWNDSLGCWRTDPLHNFASHCADAFRMLAVSLDLSRPGMSADKVREMRDRAQTGTGSYFASTQLPQARPYG